MHNAIGSKPYSIDTQCTFNNNYKNTLFSFFDTICQLVHCSRQCGSLFFVLACILGSTGMSRLVLSWQPKPGLNWFWVKADFSKVAHKDRLHQTLVWNMAWRHHVKVCTCLLSVGYCPLSLCLCLYSCIQTFTEGGWVWVDGTAGTILSSTDKELIVVSSWDTSLTIVKDCSSLISRIIPRWVIVSTKCFLNTAEQILARWLTHTVFFLFNWVTEQQWSEVIPTWRGFGGVCCLCKNKRLKREASHMPWIPIPFSTTATLLAKREHARISHGHHCKGRHVWVFAFSPLGENTCYIVTFLSFGRCFYSK